jgi:hypothetical protein
MQTTNVNWFRDICLRYVDRDVQGAVDSTLNILVMAILELRPLQINMPTMWETIEYYFLYLVLIGLNQNHMQT